MTDAQDAHLMTAARTAAAQAAALAGNIKHGSFDAVKGLELVSIAHRLSVLASGRHR